MSQNDPKGPSTQSISSARQALDLLRGQLRAGKSEPAFFQRQLDKLEQLLQQVEAGQQEQGDVRRFKALYDVSRMLGASLDLQTVLNQVMDAIIQITGAERGFLMLRDDDGGLTVQAARNFDQQTLGSDDFKYSRTIANQVLDSGRAIVTTNAAEDPRFAGQRSIVAQALRSIMATPLRARGGVIGVAYVDSRAISGLFSEADLTTLEALSGQAAVAIDNARLFSETDEELARRVEELRQLRRIDLQLNETLDPAKAMHITLEWACRLAEAGGGYMAVVEEDGGQLTVIHRYGDVEDENVPLPAGPEQLRSVIETGQRLVLEGDGEPDTAQTVLAVPVLREARVVAVVVLRRTGGEVFSAAQQELVERIVARAAVTIENARLYAAVQAANRAKSEFVGTVAHELKTPMTSIAGYTDLTLMQGDTLTERQQGFLNRVRDTVKRMEVLVSDLADVSRIESGHFFMNEIRVQVGQVVQGLRDTTTPELERRKHTWVEDIAPDLPDMYVDYYRLLQVLTNLVSNAYKYTPDGGTITLRAGIDGDRVRFSVSDTGIGLTSEQVRKLGTRFWRAQDDHTRSQPGTGLGFAITRSLVEQMGSSIEISSTPGKGSTFTFSVATIRE